VLKRTVFLFALLSLKVHSTDRVNDSLPLVTPTKQSISSGIGWLKNPEGQWVSRENRIPVFFPADKAKMIDSQQYGTGIDNFLSIRLYNINMDGKDYDLVVKVTSNGNYSSDSVYANWINTIDYNYFVLPKDSFDNVKIEDGKSLITSFDTIYVGTFRANSELSYREYGKRVYSDIKEQAKRKFKLHDGSDLKLSINTFYYSKDDVIRFVIFKSCHDREYGFIMYCGGLTRHSSSEYTSITTLRRLIVKPEIFDYLYYEVPANSFLRFVGTSVTSTLDKVSKPKEQVDLSKPNSSWVGKKFELKFSSRAGRALANKTKVVKINRIDIDNDGYKNFSVTDLDSGYLQEVYFFWFNPSHNNKNIGPRIIKYKLLND